MKKILGLDLGTNSIGWAVVNEAENPSETSSIVKIGVRVNPLTTDEKQNFEKGKSITTNSNRTSKRGMRRNLQRYKLRRNALIDVLKRHGWITDKTILSEQGKDSTFHILKLRAKAASEEISRRYALKAAEKGCKVIDCSGYFFADADVPMIVAGVNDEKLKEVKKGIVSVPSAMVTQILLPLKAADEMYKIKRLIVSTYTSTSVYGKEGMDELFNQTRKIFMNESLVDYQKVFEKQIAFNVIPQVEEFIGEETKCEWAINAETKKVLNHDIKVHANCAFIPAFIGNAAYVNVECEKEVDVDKVREQMKKTNGVIVFDKNVKGGYVTLNDVQGEIEVYVSRLRQDASVDNGFSFWSAADNLRFGMAGNAYKIMKEWLKK